MAKFDFRYGDGFKSFEYPDEDILSIVEQEYVPPAGDSEAEIVENSIDNPIGSPKLNEIIKAGETVCIVIPDITRNWSKPALVCEILVRKLNEIGIKDEDMLFISALGTHRKQSVEEHISLIGEDLYKRIKIEDHDCDNNLVETRVSSFGNRLLINANAMKYDHRILVAGCIFHFLAGFGGGRKIILPGISGRETILYNHKQYFNPGPAGSGCNENCNNGITETNPVHLDMVEAAEAAGISFIVNTVFDGEKNISHCFAGDLKKAHEAAMDMVRKIDGVLVPERADMAIVSAGGYPKDINLYQTVKPILNAYGAIKKGEGVMIIVSECRESWGNADTERFGMEFDNMLDREVYLRENFTIGMYVAYRIFDTAASVHMIVVSSMPKDLFAKTGITPADSIEEAIEIAKELTGKEKFNTYIMPYGANTCAATFLG